jgi:hypothetical protein
VIETPIILHVHIEPILILALAADRSGVGVRR